MKVTRTPVDAGAQELVFGVAGATFNTLRQASYALGISVVVTLISAASEDTSMRGIKWAFAWVLGAYLAAGIAVMVTFPQGSARDRAGAERD